ncbi:MAG TPA: alginate lyase family protein [Gaiellaceae bacterium]
MWLHALRVVRPRQAAARATRPLRRRRFPAGPGGTLRPLAENEGLWRSPAFAPSGSRPDPGSRLAAFEGHYGADVLEAARTGGDAARLAAAWAVAQPPRADDAWHPYVASTRAANWIAAATLDPSLAPAVDEGVRRAVARVAANVENDVLGNHVIRNAVALVLGGVAFDDASLRRRGEGLLARELPAQVLSDGGHYERSPAYHRLVLRDLLSVRAYTDVEHAVARMLNFAAGSSRPDGAPWLFNDGGLDIAPALELDEPADGIRVFPDTGYVFVRRGGLAFAFDCGPVSPPFLPAHAHADGLSFQLWLDGEPVVVDPGMPTYEAGTERDFFRSTHAHSTVAVGGSQFETWGAFRAGLLPQVELVDADANGVTGRVVTAHGEHTRRIRLEPDAVVVEDEARGGEAVSTLVLVRDVTVQAAVEPTRRAAILAERLGERQPIGALVQRGTSSPSWRIPVG